MMIPPLGAYRTAEALEQALGNPLDEGNLFSFRRQAALDEQEAFPEEACAFLHRWGLFEYFIPGQVGGKLCSFEEALAVLRVLARRDLTVAIALGQVYLGAIHVWLAGSEEQKQHVAQIIRQNQLLAFALTERAHGGDILANEVQATASDPDSRASGMFYLAGEKWLINNGTRARALTVFARTDPKGGPRGFSLFLVDKERLPPSAYTHCAKVKTHGIRGADISGIRFYDCPIPQDARIGQMGAGLEISLLGLMVTRTLCAGFSLGAADSALRTVLAFALKRRIYGESVFAIPSAQSTLAYAFCDLLIADCVSIAAARGLHVVPEQFSVWSAIVKYFVPTTVENLIRDLSVVLGARYYLREEHNAGIFEKLLRDNAVVSLFDGSTAVNLSIIGAQLASLSAHRRKLKSGNDERLRARLDKIFCLTHPLPEFVGSRLTLFNRGQDDILQGMSIAVEQLKALDSGLAPDVLAGIVALGREVVEQIRVEEQRVQEQIGGGRAALQSPAVFELAKGYSSLHAAVACLQMWLYNRTLLGDFFARGEWLVLCLDRLLARFHPSRNSISPALVATVAREAVRLYEQDQAFSIIPFQYRVTSDEC